MGYGTLAHSAGPITAATIDQEKKIPKVRKPTALEIPQRSLQRELYVRNTGRNFVSLQKQKSKKPNKTKQPQTNKTNKNKKNLHSNFSPYRI